MGEHGKVGQKHVRQQYGKVTAIGTGGNISKIFELAQLKPHRLMSLKKYAKSAR